MKALLCAPPSVALTTQAAMPIPPQGESLVKVVMTGICRTDLELTRGYMGFEGILGHEFVGMIDDDSSPLAKGTRVVGEINAGCGKCQWCGKGLERHCPNRSVLGILNRNGCMAQWLTLPYSNLLPVPAALSNQDATFTEPVAAVLEIFEQIKVEPAHRVCILGDGKLGLLTAMVFGKKHDGPLTLVGHHKTKLDTVSDFCTTCLETDSRDQACKSWDLVIDVTGKSSGLQLAMQLVKPRGTIVLKSTMAAADALDLTPLVIDEITVVGSRCGQFAPALSFLTKHSLPLHRIIDRIYSMDKAQEAWQHANTPGALKILLQVE
jgi:threonine dehydrogenase-like Zn-dependent dehydrogenase